MLLIFFGVRVMGLDWGEMWEEIDIFVSIDWGVSPI